MALHLRMAVSRILTRFLYEARLPWPWFQDMFPGCTFNPSVILRTIWHVFARHGKLDIPVYVLQIVGVVLLMARFEFYEAASQSFQVFIYGCIWLIVFTVSSICCWTYYQLLRYTWRKHQLLIEQSNKYGLIFVVSVVAVTLCLGLLSSYTLAPQVYERIDEMEFSAFWKVIFIITACLWICEKVLSSIWMALVLPITLAWASQLSSDEKDIVVELFPWKVFVFLHRIILLTTFFGRSWCQLDYWCHFEFMKDGVQIISLLYRVVAIVWLFVLVMYIVYRQLSQEETQHLVSSTPEEHRHQEMVVGVLPLWQESQGSASGLELYRKNLVTGLTSPLRMELYSSPDSELVTGRCSAWNRATPYDSAGASDT